MERSVEFPILSDSTLLILALLLLGYCGYGLLFRATDVEPQGGEVVGTIVADPWVKRRLAGSVEWAVLEQERKLYLRDIVYTPPETRATVRLKNGKVIQLEPNSLVQLDEIFFDSFEITLLQSPFKVMPYPVAAREALAALPPSEELRQKESDWISRATSVLQSSIARNRDFAKIEAIPTLDMDNLDFYSIKTINPKPGKYPLESSQWMRFGWTTVPVSQVRYLVEFARDGNFKASFTRPTRSNSLVIQMDRPGIFYWRVKAMKGNFVVVSETSQFEMVDPNASPDGVEEFKGPTEVAPEIKPEKDFDF